MVPLAIQPSRPRHVDFNAYYMPRSDADYPYQLRRFADSALWHDAIFAHLQQQPELLMHRLWQCVEANNEGRRPPSLDDIVDQPTIPWTRTAAVWGALLLICVFLVLRRLRVLR